MKSLIRKLSMFCVTILLSMITVGISMAAEPTRPHVPPGWVAVEEDIYHVFDDEPSAYFYNAHESFMKGDLKAAARELRKAAAFVKLESDRATVEGEMGLDSSYKELNKLANDVEKGNITFVRDLEIVFARTHQTLAKHHYLKALEARNNKNAKATGQFMISAVIHLEHGFAWSDYKIQDTEEASLKKIRILSEKLVAGAGWAPDEIGKDITWLGKEIEKLGSITNEGGEQNLKTITDG